MNHRSTLLLACGTPESRRIVRRNLDDHYYLLEATSIRHALALLEQGTTHIAAVLIDVSSPETLDVELMVSQATLDTLARFPIIVIARNDDPIILDQAFSLGASDVIPLHYDAFAMLHRIENIVQVSLHKQSLEEQVRLQAKALRQTNDSMVDALSSIIEYRSVESGQHIQRIRSFTRVLLEQLAQYAPEYHLTEDIISIITSASTLHDVGKIGIPDTILTKPGRLTAEEMDIMRTHTTIGCQILESMGNIGNEEYLRYAHNICHHHHERWDGKGYPTGISGDDIPICAQVVGLADVYDALTSKRVYKDAYSFDTAVNMILNGECGMFSPKLLECFKMVLPRYQELAHAYADGRSISTGGGDGTLLELAPSKAIAEEDPLGILSGNLHTLLHYINVFTLELSLDHGLYQIHYNPYPELDILSHAKSFPELRRMILDKVVCPSDREAMQDLIDNGVVAFLKTGQRQQRFRFSLRGASGRPEPCELTLLVTTGYQATKRFLTVFCLKLDSDSPSPSLDSLEPLQMRDFICCRNDRSLTFVKAGPGISVLAQYTLDEIDSVFGGSLLKMVYTKDRRSLMDSFREQFSRGLTAQTEFRLVCKDGQLARVFCKSTLWTGPDGNEYLYHQLSDISARQEAYDVLRDRLEHYEIILAQTENVLFEWDLSTDRASFSDTWETLFGYALPSTNFRTLLTAGSCIHPDDFPALLERFQALELGSSYEMADIRITTSQGRYLWCRVRASALRDEEERLTQIVGVILNIDEEKQQEQALRDQANRDILTKLLNKEAGRKQIEDYLAAHTGEPSAMLIIDLDHFKRVNDRYGHLFGDTVLLRTVKEIKKLFRSQDIITRIGGDEFLVLIRGAANRALVESRCRRLQSAIHSAFQTEELDLDLSCSIGIAMAPEHGSTYRDLFHSADLALYLAKTQGRTRYAFYSVDAAMIKAAGEGTTAVSHSIDSDKTPGLASQSLVRHAFHLLNGSQNLQDTIPEILAIIGKQTNVSRVYVFENSIDDSYCINTFEWCNTGISPEIRNLQHVSYTTDIPGYPDNFDEQGIFYCSDITTLDERTRMILDAQNIKSILHYAIREEGVFRGFIGFDECTHHRMWTQEQIDLLSYFSDVLSLFLLRRRAQALADGKIRQLERRLEELTAGTFAPACP